MLTRLDLVSLAVAETVVMVAVYLALLTAILEARQAPEARATPQARANRRLRTVLQIPTVLLKVALVAAAAQVSQTEPSYYALCPHTLNFPTRCYLAVRVEQEHVPSCMRA